MSEAYVECLVKQKTPVWATAFKFILYALICLLGAGTLLLQNIVLFLLAIITFVAVYFINMLTDIEYEYLYLDKELSVDKVMAKTKRKKVATYYLDRIEIIAPVKSYHLDNYKNRQVKVRDFSIGYEEQPDERYALYYEGGEKLLLSPSEELVKVLKNAAPRKVFSE